MKLLLANSTIVLLCVGVCRAQTYQQGSTGMFGLGEGYSYNLPTATLNATNDATSASFRAFENIGVDRIFLRLVGVDPGTTIRVGVMEDDGTGKPDGIFGTSSVHDPVDGNTESFYTFGATNLSAGSVYHVVVRPETVGGSESFQVYGSGYFGIRPYDRRKDPNFHATGQDSGGVWIATTNRSPFFVLGNGSNVGLAGPSMPYTGVNTSLTRCRGSGSGTSAGQRFTIFDTEVPADARVTVSNVVFVPSKSAGCTNDLLVQLREADLTVLASGKVVNAQITGVAVTSAWNTAIELLPETPYLVTFEFSPPRPTTTTTYIYLQNMNGGYAGFGPATWGSTNACAPVESNGGGGWLSYTISSTSALDIRIWFQGRVTVPAILGTTVTIR